MITISYDGNVYTIHDIAKLPNLYRIIDPTCETLEYDVFNFSVRSNGIGEQKILEKYGLWLSTNSDQGIVVDDGNFEDFVYGTPVELRENGNLKATFYVTNVQPTNKMDNGAEIFRVESVSSIGILSRVEHLGGMYFGETAGNIISDIMGDIPYSIDQDLEGELLYGWLPAVKDARKNLHKVLFATGAIIRRDSNGDMRFTYNYPETVKQIPKSRTFYGGIVSKKEYKSSITVVEHNYYESAITQEELIYDSTGASYVSDSLVTFDEPHYAYRGDGITVNSSSANWARVTGVGKIYAKPYVHMQRSVTRNLNNDAEPDVLSVSDQTLVSSLNVNAIVDRLAHYYGGARVRSIDIQVNDEEPGDLVEFYDRRGNLNAGYIKSIDETASSFWRGSVKVVTDWGPIEGGNNFTHSIIVTEGSLEPGGAPHSGIWNVPNYLQMIGKKARFVLFSGAEGGQGGYAGETMGVVTAPSTAKRVYQSSSGNRETQVGDLQSGVQRGGKGGKGGSGGASATRMINIDIASVAPSYMIQFGQGGYGGAGGTVTRDANMNVVITDPEWGQPGGDSQISISQYGGWVSTSSGTVFNGTYMNLITGKILASKGMDGIAGGDGGRGGYSEQMRGPFTSQADAQGYDYSIRGKGLNGDSVGSSVNGTFTGGTGANGTLGAIANSAYNWNIAQGYWLFGNAGGGGGGGAAMGNDGGDGQAGYSSNTSFNERSGGTSTTVTHYYVNSYDENDDEAVRLNGASGGDGADATAVPLPAEHYALISGGIPYAGGVGGYGGGGGGGAGQCMGKQFTTSSSGTYRDHYYGEMYGGKGGNGGYGGMGSNGFMVVYW